MKFELNLFLSYKLHKCRRLHKGGVRAEKIPGLVIQWIGTGRPGPLTEVRPLSSDAGFSLFHKVKLMVWAIQISHVRKNLPRCAYPDYEVKQCDVIT